jgi:hypothetical protein
MRVTLLAILEIPIQKQWIYSFHGNVENVEVMAALEVGGIVIGMGGNEEPAFFRAD